MAREIVGGEEVERLMQTGLVEVARRDGGWATLLRDPGSGAYWERDYPSSEYHGGGPPRLRELSVEEVRLLYGAGAVATEE
jgi:hypothetical protein